MTLHSGTRSRLPFEHVLRVVRTQIAPASASSSSEPELEPLDTREERKEFIRLAEVHRVYPIVLSGLRALPNEMPAPLVQALHRAVLRRSLRSMALRTEMGRLASRMHEAALPFVVLKGIAVQSAYGSLSLRHSADNDILVRPEDFGALEQILSDAGYTCRRRGASQKKAYLLIHGQYTFERQDGEHAFYVDAHTRVMPLGYRYSEGVPDLLRRSRTLHIDGVPVPVPSWEDLIVILSTNGLKDRWTQLRLVTDLVVVSARVTDWDAVAQLAERANCREQVALGLSLTADLFDLPLPAPFASRSASVDRLARALADELRGVPGAQDLAGRVELFLSAQDSVHSRLRYVLYTGLRRAAEPLFHSAAAG